MIVKFNFEPIAGGHKVFSVNPYRVSNDYDYYTDYLFDVTYQAYPFFQQVDNVANRINLYDILYDDFIQLYHGGVDYDTPVGDEITLFTTEVAPNGGTPITGSAYYTLSYRIANPYNLTFNITSGEILDENQATNTHAITIDFTPSHKFVEREKYYIIALEKKVVNSLYIEYNGKDYTDFKALNIGVFPMCYCPTIAQDWEVDAVSGETYLDHEYQLYYLHDIDELPRLPGYSDWGALTPPGYSDRQWLYASGKYGYSSTSETGWPTSYAVQPWYTLCCADAVIKINGEVYDFADDEAENLNDTNEATSYNGPYSDQSDRIPMDGTPLNDALSTGFIHAYLLTPVQSQNLANYMLTDTFLNAVKKLMAAPIDYVLSFVMHPVIPTIGAQANVLIGGVDTGCPGRPITKEFATIDAGTIKCKEFWGGFQDYAPSTRVSIYVPFSGIHQLDVDDCMDGSLTLTYRVDVLTGEGVATLHCTTSRGIDSELYHWPCSIAASVPITATDYHKKLDQIIGGSAQLANVAVGAAMGAPNIGGLISGSYSMIQGTMSKPTMIRSGSIAGTAGILDNYTPFLIIERPAQALPKYFKELNGFASEVGGLVGSFSGFLQVKSVDLTAACTDTERDEIERYLKGGVFV